MSKELIIKRLRIIREVEEELRKLKEHYDEALENDKDYQKIQEEISKVKEQHQETQQRIVSNPSFKSMQEQIKEKRTELKENKEVLSMELVDYYKDNGLPEIEDEDGNVKKMKFSVKLVN